MTARPFDNEGTGLSLHIDYLVQRKFYKLHI